MQKIGVKDWKRINPPRMTSRNHYCEIAWLLTHSRRATCRSPLPYKEPASGILCIRYQASLLLFQSVFCIVNLYCYQATTLSFKRCFFDVCRGFCFRMGKNAWGFALVAVFMAVGAVAQAPSPSSSSSSDCTSAITSLSPCLSFVTTNSNETKPGNDCCTALSAIVSTKVLCLCQVLSGNNNLGLPINRTKALALPGACNVKTPPISQCAAAGAPSTSFGVPVSSPALSPQTSKTPAKAPAASTPAPTKATLTPTSATPAAAPVLAPVTTVSPPLPAPTLSPSGSPTVSSPPVGSPSQSVSSSSSGPSPATSGGPAAGSAGVSPAPGSSTSGSTATVIFTPSTLLVLVGVALAGVQW